METVYIETTVVSYLVSRPSQDVVVAAHQQLTQEWWRRRRRSFACFISDVVLDEVSEGDAEQAALRLQALEGIPKLVATAEGERLAAAFLASAPACESGWRCGTLGDRDGWQGEIRANMELQSFGQRAVVRPARTDRGDSRLQTPAGLHARGTDGSVGL